MSEQTDQGSDARSGVPTITPAAPSNLDAALDCLVAAFADDPITGFLLQAGAGYPQRLRQFFSLLMRARLALGMPVLLARDATGLLGAAMGYTTARLDWPTDIAADWERFEQATPALTERIAVYDQITTRCQPAAPHYYLGVIGVHPHRHGRGIGMQLLEAFCAQSAADGASSGVYLETANPANVGFYERAGFVQTGRGSLDGATTLWCMYRAQPPRPTGSLFDAAGGAAGALRLAEAWHRRVLADPVVAHAFSHGFHPQHTERLAAYWAEAWGGPPDYSRLHGSESSVVRRHSGNGPHEEMDRRAIQCFDAAMADAGLADATLRQVLHDYFEWATTTTMSAYPDNADDVPAGLRIPRWSWQGLQP